MKSMGFFLFCLLSVSLTAQAFIGKHFELREIPVQSGGRVKPFDTFARESLRFIHGKTKIEKTSATEVLLLWMLFPKYWDQTEFIQIPEEALKKALNLDLKKNLFSPKELSQSSALAQEITELRIRQGESLDEYFQSVQNLENRLVLYRAFQAGKIPGWIPISSNKAWRTLSEFNKKEKELFENILVDYISSKPRPLFLKGQAFSGSNLKEGEGTIQEGEGTIQEGEGTIQQDYSKQKAVSDFQNYITYPKGIALKISAELHYNGLNPFRWAWVFYLLGFLFLCVLFFKRDFQRKIITITSLVWLVGFLLQAWGMALRSFIMGRPPVSNMYETVIWVPWVGVILGAIFWRWKKNFTVFACSCMVALLCLSVADFGESLLDSRLEPLTAVLRSHFWLITHVLVITMSYSAFFVAFALGDFTLFLFLKHRKTNAKIQNYVMCIYRFIQVGVVLLALGTVLGGIWADYSWGRFWGWDPKETWALITLLGYLALLHGKLVGWIKDFGMAVGSVLLFFLVIMAWYGVNYVLGQGLHSYGFGAGGVEYVAGFAVLHLIYVLLVWTFYSVKR